MIKTGLAALNAYYFDALDQATAELFESAVCRFLESHAPSECGELLVLHTEVLGRIRRKSIQLWSADVVTQFARYWAEILERHAPQAR